MEIDSLAAALEREHREIDDGIEAFRATLPSGDHDRRPLTRAIRALRRHIYLEEEYLFPALRDAGLVAPVFVMLREHAQIWKVLDALDAEPDDRAAVARCDELAVQLLHHNLKEERVLYPQADEALSAPAGQQLRTFLDAGVLPEGWVCAKAQGGEDDPNHPRARARAAWVREPRMR